MDWRVVLASIGMMAGTLCLPAAAGGVIAGKTIIHDGRPDILQPRNMTACELRHLGGPWWPDSAMTRAERKRMMDEVRAEVANVRKHCANGTENQLL
jgi:hypothetical protein